MTIIHPHHPLYQQHAEIVRIRRGTDPDLIIRLSDGSHAAVAMSLTDYANQATELPVFDPLPLLDIEGLRHMVQFIDRLRKEGRYD